MRPPDRRWVVLAASFLAAFATWVGHAAFGVFVPILSQDFGWSRGAISFAFTLNMLVGGGLGFLVGAATDRYGARRLMAVSALLVGAAFMLASAISALWQFHLLMGFLAGVGTAGIYLVPTAVVSRWFTTQRGLAVGILLSSIGLAYVAGPPLAAFLVGLAGWRTAYLMIGALVWLVALPASGLMLSPPATPPPGAPPGASDGEITLRGALGRGVTWAIFAIWALMGFTQMMVQVHIVAYATDLGLDLESASLAMTVHGVSTVIGRLIFGAAADRLGTRVTFFLCTALELVTTVGLVASPPPVNLYGLMVLFGLGSAGNDTALVKTVMEIFGTRAIGGVMGVLSLGWRIGAAAGPVVGGYAYDATGAYATSLTVATLVLVAAAGFFAAIRPGRVARPPSTY